LKKKGASKSSGAYVRSSTRWSRKSSRHNEKSRAGLEPQARPETRKATLDGNTE
jgi:hypothetical protein